MPKWVSLFFSENAYHLQLKEKKPSPFERTWFEKVRYLSVDIMVLFHLGVLLHL